MNKLNLMLMDYDESYLAYLNNFMSSSYKGKYEINCFSDKETFLEQIKSIRNKDILVINRELYDDSLENLGIKTILQLVEGNIESEEEKVVHKYKDVINLHDIAIKAYLESDPKQLSKIYSNNADTKVISVYSPIGGSGKSTIAAALSAELVRQGKEVFYLNFEDVQSTDVYFSNEIRAGSKNLSDMIFEIKDRAEDFEQKLLTGIEVDRESKVAYLNTTANILDIEDMTEEDIKWLLEGIINTKKYHYVIIDMSSKFNSIYNIILNSSDRIITPLLNDATSVNKIEKLTNDISNVGKYYFLYNIYDGLYDLETPECLYNRYNINIDLVIREDKQIRKYKGKDILNTPIINNAINEIIIRLNL